jgi:hypothetical protein
MVSIALLIMIGILGCSREDRILEPESFPTNAEVFKDEFGSSVIFQAFEGSKYDALDIDQVTTYSGSQSLQVIIPDVGDPSGSYAGGAFTANIGRNLSEYNALTFYAKASMNATLDVVGTGNDNTGTSRFTAEVRDLALTTEWQKFVIPIPLSEKLTNEKGLFFFAEGPENGSGYQLWFDEIVFESLGTISNPQPTIPTITINAEVNDTISIEGASVTFDAGGSPLSVSAMQGYFTFFSSDSSVVNVAGNGVISAVGVGTADLTANLGTIQASGTVTVEVAGTLATPTTPAPTPTVPEADVISLFSNAYTDVTVDTWLADWEFSDADLSNETIGTDDVKKYGIRTYAGIDFSSSTIDATGMTRFHMDIWTPNSTASPAEFKIKLVDFGADGIFGGNDDVEHELKFSENTSPGLASETWISIDVPLTAFSGLLTRGHLAQMVISGDLSTVYVDNIYFYDAGVQTAPTIPAPTPNKDPNDVISLFSDVYTNVDVDTWSAIWDIANVEDYMIGSDSTKKYTNLLFAGIEFASATIDATAMTHFHIDVWTPDATSSPSVFKIKLVDFGANGVYDQGGNDDVEHEITLDENTMSTGIWVSIDLSLDVFTDLTTKEHLGQLIISGDPDTVYVDNIYFYDSGIPTTPTIPAPTPTVHPDSVFSIFSDAYTSTPFDVWSPEWDQGDVTDFNIGTDNLKKYVHFGETWVVSEYTVGVTGPQDISDMTHFHIDVWTPDATDGSSQYKIKLVDYGANGVWDGGGDDAEHELVFDNATMSTGNWISFDIPLTDFAGLTTKEHFAQLILSGTYGTVFIDNVYFHQ